MGIIPGPVEYGDDCLTCWDPGLTPRLFKLFLSGIGRGELWLPGMGMPPNGYHDLVQSSTVPCQWLNLKPGPPSILWQPTKLLLNLSVPMPLASNAFTAREYPQCSRQYDNDSEFWQNSNFYGGFAFITVGGPAGGDDDDFLHSLSSIIESVTPMIDPDPRMECFPMSVTEIAVRYAGKRDATNIVIKFDTSA